MEHAFGIGLAGILGLVVGSVACFALCKGEDQRVRSLLREDITHCGSSSSSQRCVTHHMPWCTTGLPLRYLRLDISHRSTWAVYLAVGVLLKVVHQSIMALSSEEQTNIVVGSMPAKGIVWNT